VRSTNYNSKYSTARGSVQPIIRAYWALKSWLLIYLLTHLLPTLCYVNYQSSIMATAYAAEYSSTESDSSMPYLDETTFDEPILPMTAYKWVRQSTLPSVPFPNSAPTPIRTPQKEVSTGLKKPLSSRRYSLFPGIPDNVPCATQQTPDLLRTTGYSEDERSVDLSPAIKPSPRTKRGKKARSHTSVKMSTQQSTSSYSPLELRRSARIASYSPLKLRRSARIAASNACKAEEGLLASSVAAAVAKSFQRPTWQKSRKVIIPAGDSKVVKRSRKRLAQTESGQPQLSPT
jgi:hypothetical protein